MSPWVCMVWAARRITRASWEVMPSNGIHAPAGAWSRAAVMAFWATGVRLRGVVCSPYTAGPGMLVVRENAGGQPLFDFTDNRRLVGVPFWRGGNPRAPRPHVEPCTPHPVPSSASHLRGWGRGGTQARVCYAGGRAPGGVPSCARPLASTQMSTAVWPVGLPAASGVGGAGVIRGSTNGMAATRTPSGASGCRHARSASRARASRVGSVGGTCPTSALCARPRGLALRCAHGARQIAWTPGRGGRDPHEIGRRCWPRCTTRIRRRPPRLHVWRAARR